MFDSHALLDGGHDHGEHGDTTYEEDQSGHTNKSHNPSDNKINLSRTDVS